MYIYIYTHVKVYVFIYIYIYIYTYISHWLLARQASRLRDISAPGLLTNGRRRRLEHPRMTTDTRTLTYSTHWYIINCVCMYVCMYVYIYIYIYTYIYICIHMCMYNALLLYRRILSRQASTTRAPSGTRRRRLPPSVLLRYVVMY